MTSYLAVTFLDVAIGPGSEPPPHIAILWVSLLIPHDPLNPWLDDCAHSLHTNIGDQILRDMSEVASMRAVSKKPL